MGNNMIPSTDDGLTYCCSPTITWLRDTDQILLVDEERGHLRSIRGAEAAIWDFLTLAYPFEKVACFLALLLKTSTGEAAATLLAVLHDWQDEGILQVAREDHRG